MPGDHGHAGAGGGDDLGFAKDAAVGDFEREVLVAEFFNVEVDHGNHLEAGFVDFAEHGVIGVGPHDKKAKGGLAVEDGLDDFQGIPHVFDLGVFEGRIGRRQALPRPPGAGLLAAGGQGQVPGIAHHVPPVVVGGVFGDHVEALGSDVIFDDGEFVLIFEALEEIALGQGQVRGVLVHGLRVLQRSGRQPAPLIPRQALVVEQIDDDRDIHARIGGGMLRAAAPDFFGVVGRGAMGDGQTKDNGEKQAESHVFSFSH